MMSVDINRARDFILRNARLIDRLRFAWRFEQGQADVVLAALRPYENRDGGFGNALEPDLRCAASQPVPTEHALLIMDEIGEFQPDIVSQCCDWLMSVTTAEGGVPFVLTSVDEGPHASWWVATSKASLNPTAGIVGLLHKHHVNHPWVAQATAYCWAALSASLDELGADDAISVLHFLEHVPERDRAESALGRLGRHILSKLVAFDSATPGYVKMPLEFAPHPERIARRLFDQPTIEQHLDALEGRQQEDGGWPITWKPPSQAAASEWRAVMTLKWLDVLQSYGRLE